MNLVILGDCKSNGLNTMAWKITNDPSIVIDVSLAYNKNDKEVIKWFMTQGKTKTNPQSISTRNLRQESYKEYALLEMAQSWPCFLKGKVYNYSKTGTTFQGYLAEIQKHMNTYSKPDLVCITDYSDDHVYVRTKHCQEKHNAPVFRTFLNQKYDSNIMPYSKEIYLKRQAYGTNEYNAGQGYLNRKTKHSFYFLQKYLERNQINYFFVRFRNGSSSSNFDYQKTVDVNDIHKIYKRPDGEHSKMLFDQQKNIAKRVQDYIDNAFSSTI